ncbi:MAG: autotransporter-associated beta strand repeat-containing protein [Pirellulales bacterium]|nr:autotransporter-associated beta strand repeat-containing protein [Pirellulales bacterium]
MAIAFLAFSTASVRAVIVAGGDGTGNAAPPADALGDPGWANVGRGNHSCVYLGNRWVLTCAHVGAAGTTYFNGIGYNLVPGSNIRLRESADGNPANFVDLLLYRIDAAPPGLAELSIAGTSPAFGALVTAVGLGTERGAATPTGFLWGDVNHAKRWGRNLISSTYSGTINVGYGNTHVFQTRFDQNPVSPLDPSLAYNEFQASTGDSGGAVFGKVNNAWKLTGILEAVSTYGSANYGDTTYSIDLSFYRDQIVAAAATCPFAGTIVDPVSTLGAGVSAYLSGNGGFKPLAGACSVSVDTKSFSFTFDTGSNTISQTGVISGNGGFTKYGAGNMKLSQHNTFSGTTTVNQGTLTLDGGDLGNSPLVSLAAGTRLEATGGAPRLLDIGGNGSISVLGGATALTARSIRAEALTIGGAAAAAVPEPSASILIGAFLLMLSAAFCRARRAI